MDKQEKYTKDDYALELRHDILLSALILEKLSAQYLAALLGIKNYESTKSFGNKSGNLSYNQKIELLIDIDAISKDHKKKFQTFMEIRNQFMHNINVKTYTECFNLLDGRETFLLKLYPLGVETIKEVKLRIATEKLAVELIALLTSLVDKIFNYEVNKLKFEIFEKMQPEYSRRFKSIKLIYETQISVKTKLENGLSHQELTNLDKEIFKNFKDFWS